MGSFIRRHSFLHPEINYLGFEINTTVLYKAMKRYENELEEAGREAVPAESNLRFIRSDARFLADYFNGDVYFHNARPGQNLYRARTHIKMAQMTM